MSKDVLKFLYHNAFRGMALYGAEVWGPRAKDTRLIRQLEAIQRPFALQMCRAFKTTATKDLQVIAGLIPLHIEANTEYTHRKKYKEDIEYHRSKGKFRIHPASDTLDQKVIVEMENTPDNDIQITRIYVDATKQDDGRTGIGLTIYKDNTIRELHYRLQDDITILIAETKAIEVGLGIIKRDNILGTINLYTDSLITLKKLKNYNNNDRHIAELKKLLEQNNRGERNTTLRWLDRNSMNRQAPGLDNTTRRGPRHEEIQYQIHKTKKELKMEKHEENISKWQEKWTHETNDKLIGKILPAIGTDRIELSFKATQIITGHGYMNSYYRRFNLRRTHGSCECGEGVEDVNHVIYDCNLRIRVEANNEVRRIVRSRNEEFPPSLYNRNNDRDKIREINKWCEDLIVGEALFVD